MQRFNIRRRWSEFRSTLADRDHRSDRPLLLSDSAWCSFAPGVTADEAGLHEVGDGRVYRVEAPAPFLQALTEGATVSQLARQLYEAGAEQDQARTDVVRLLSELDREHLSSISQPPSRDAIERLRLLGLWVVSVVLLQDGDAFAYRLPAERYDVRPLRILQACARAHAWNFLFAFLLSSSLVYITAYQSGLLAYTVSTALQAAAMAAVLFIGMFTSALLHEFGHYLTAVRLGVPILSIYSRSGAAGLTVVPQTIRERRLVGVAGVVFACVPLILAIGAIVVLPAPDTFVTGKIVLVFALVIILVLQIWDLVPWSEDGKLVWSREP